MKRHRFDPASFVFGAMFLIVGLTFLVGGPGSDASRPVRLWPATVIVVGLSLAIWAVSRAVSREPATVTASDIAAVTPGPDAGSESPAPDDASTTTTIELPSGEDDQEEGPRP